MRSPSTPDLRLRFSIDQIARLAAAYAYAEDTEVRMIGTEARNRGWYTRQELVTVALGRC